jgi:methylisocitrate lyase
MVMPICFVLNGHPVSQMSPDDQMALYAQLIRDIDGPVKGVMIPEGYAVEDMAASGYRVMGMSAVCIEAATNALYEALSDLRQNGSNAHYRAAHPPAMPAPGGVMDLMRISEYLKFERRFTDETR